MLRLVTLGHFFSSHLFFSPYCFNCYCVGENSIVVFFFSGSDRKCKPRWCRRRSSCRAISTLENVMNNCWIGEWKRVLFPHLTNTCNKTAFPLSHILSVKKKRTEVLFCCSPRGVLLRRLSPSVTCCSSRDSVLVLHYAPFLFLLSLPFMLFLPSLFPAWYHALRHDHITCCCCCCVCVCRCACCLRV